MYCVLEGKRSLRPFILTHISAAYVCKNSESSRLYSTNKVILFKITLAGVE